MDYAKTHYGFPRGKRNQDETDVLCAIREAREEIGFDITNLINPKVSY